MLHLRSGDFAAAARDAEKAVSIKSKPDARTLLEIGHLRLRQRDLAGAKKAFEEALRLVPRYGLAQEGLLEAKLLESSGPGTIIRVRLHS